MAFPNTSISERWATPQWLFDRLDAEFYFRLDAAADASNHKCSDWLGPGGLFEDALDATTWYQPTGPVWCNPPYSKKNGGILPWMERGRATARSGSVCVMLIYARTDTKAWTLCHDYADEIRLIKGRLKFSPPPDYVGEATAAGAPSALIIFRPETAHMGRVGGAQYRMMEKP